MTVLEAEDVIYGGIVAAWAGLTPVEWPNRTLDIAALQEWIRVSLQYQSGDQENLGGPGGRLFRYIGEITVQTFAPAGNGTQRSAELVEALLNIFRTGALGFVTVRGPRPTVVGRDGAWWQVNVSAEFVYDLVD